MCTQLYFLQKYTAQVSALWTTKSEQQHPLLYLQDELIFKMAAFVENRPPWSSKFFEWHSFCCALWSQPLGRRFVCAELQDLFINSFLLFGLRWPVKYVDIQLVLYHCKIENSETLLLYVSASIALLYVELCIGGNSGFKYRHKFRS